MLIPKVAVRPKSLQIERGRLTSLINSMADGVIATDETGKVLLYNGAALNILDINNTIEGKALASILNLLDKNRQAVDIQKLIQSAKTPIISRDYLLPYADGSAINLYLSVAPVRLGFGQSEDGNEGYVLVLRDITREKSLEEERDEFISVVSHELRTPIAVAEGNISNALFLVEKGGDLGPVKDALDQTHAQINFLADMINDLSTLSRAERGKLAVELESINVHELLVELIHNYQPEATGKGLTLNLNLDPNLRVLTSSKLYVREILQNFITNAIKYTEHGSVTVSAVSQANGVQFTIQDTGIGISKQDQAKIFDKFFRSEDYRTRKNSGTGLGLYVTMKLAKLLFAKISLNSELNKGSAFHIFIPNLQQPIQRPKTVAPSA